LVATVISHIGKIDFSTSFLLGVGYVGTSMLLQLQLENFKCFRRHKIPFKQQTVLVGQNNAGKSTVVEALRLVALVANRFGRSPIRPVPEWLEIHKVYRGIQPSLGRLDLNFKSIFHRYNPPPAILRAKFEDGTEIVVYIGGENKIHGVLLSADGNVLTSTTRSQLPRISILPQISPLQEIETVLGEEYVRRADSQLASLHFRNQLNLEFHRHFEKFRAIAEQTWHGLQINEFRGQGGSRGTELELMIRNDDFVAEVGWMGHGLQMWLQIMWFLARNDGDRVVILDEPDVYMHADLQRRLVRLLTRRHQQVIVATHAVEMMAEVEASSILIVDRGRTQTKFANADPAVQQVIDRIGAVHNLQLARLWNARKCLFIEGDDLAILSVLYNKLFPDTDEPLEIIPHLSVGGWTGWTYVIGSAMLMDSTAGEEIRAYAIFDRDFHTHDQIQERYADAKKRQIELHIWGRKEIENYLIVPEAIHRLMAAAKEPPTLAIIQKLIERIVAKYRHEVTDDVSNEFLMESREGGIQNANRKARAQMKAWDQDGGPIKLAPGKRILADLSNACKKKFNISFGVMKLARELKPNEIPSEIANVLHSLQTKESFGGYVRDRY
jgi:predicted ATPase